MTTPIYIDERTMYPEVGSKDAAMWKAQVNRLEEFLAECQEQRDVAWARIDQLTQEIAGMKTHVTYEEYFADKVANEDDKASREPSVDHLAEANNIDNSPEYRQIHALIAIAESLRSMLGTYPNGETYVNARVQGSMSHE
ncbi:MAG: hypothetical protein ACOYD4_11770 [Solirubrobacterales bacterium]